MTLEEFVVKSLEDIKISRRGLLKTGTILAASSALYPGIGAFAKSDNPVKIGFIDPETGTYAVTGKSEIRGAKMAADQINGSGGILGRPLQMHFEDAAANPGQAVQKAHKLVHRNKVDFLEGAVSSAVAEALSHAAHEMNVLYIDTGGHADDVTGKNCRWNTFRTCMTTWLCTAGDFQTIFDQYGKRWFFITPDYAFGHYLHRDYVKQLKAAGGTPVGNALAPLGTTNFSTYLIKAKAANPDALLVLTSGDDLTNSLKQITQFGLNKDMGVGGPLMEMENLMALPANARYGYWNMEWYWNQPDTPHVMDFVKAYKKRYGSVPTARSWFGFASTHAIALACEKAKSVDSMKVAKAMEGMELPPEIALQPNNPHYDARTHQMIANSFPGQVRHDGKTPHLFDLSKIVDNSTLMRPYSEIGCTIEYPAA